MTTAGKQILLRLVDEVELLRAHSLYQGELLFRQGIRVSPAEARDGVIRAKQDNQKFYDELRQQIEVLA